MYKGKKVLAIIPARKGSKRFPDKNIAQINGMTLVELAIIIASGCKYIDHIVVTSNDDRTYTPLIESHSGLWLNRPEDLSQGETGSIKRTWQHAWQEGEKQWGEFEYSVLLEPTSPNRIPGDIEKCISCLTKHVHVATVTKEPKLFYKYGLDVKQLYGPFFKMNGLCYASRDRNEDLFNCCHPIVTDRRVANIDYPEDLELARFLFD